MQGSCNYQKYYKMP